MTEVFLPARQKVNSNGWSVLWLQMCCGSAAALSLQHVLQLIDCTHCTDLQEPAIHTVVKFLCCKARVVHAALNSATLYNFWGNRLSWRWAVCACKYVQGCVKAGATCKHRKHILADRLPCANVYWGTEHLVVCQRGSTVSKAFRLSHVVLL